MEQNITGMRTRDWIVISASIFGPIVVILIILISIGCYGHSHPDGMISYLFFRSGIRLFEPSFSGRQEPSELLAGLKSYGTVSNVQAELKDRGVGSEVKYAESKSALEKGSVRLAAEGIAVSGQTGSLSLAFLNDRLWMTTFYASNHDAFLPAFEEEYHLSFAATNAVHWSSHSIVELGFRKNKQTKKPETIITILDERLQREVNAWSIRDLSGSAKNR